MSVNKDIRDSSSSLSPTPPPSYSIEGSPGHKYSRPGDADLVTAAEALTQLTNSANSPGSGSITASSSPGPSDGRLPPISTNQHPLVTHVNQVTKHPIVTNALKYYETSKRNYAPFNYAAEIVEKAAIPVVNKIESNLNNRHQAAKRKESESQGSSSAKKRRLPQDGEDVKSVSIETKKRLQFCLHVLHLANNHINDSVNFLQQKISDREQAIKDQREKKMQEEKELEKEKEELEKEEQEKHDYSSDNKIQTEGSDIPSQEAQQTKTEIATTVKKIIHLISDFRPSSLSTEGLSPASTNSTTSATENNDLKANIRDIILKLPSTIHQSALSNTTSAQANDKIFVFAKESLDMITKLTNVFNEQLVKAETWVGGEESNAQDVSSTSTVDSSSSLATAVEETQETQSSESKRVKVESES